MGRAVGLAVCEAVGAEVKVTVAGGALRFVCVGRAVAFWVALGLSVTEGVGMTVGATGSTTQELNSNIISVSREKKRKRDEIFTE
jgi:hypothetical protein